MIHNRLIWFITDCVYNLSIIMKIYICLFIIISLCVQFSFTDEENCAKTCVCPKILMPHCDVDTTVKFDNKCIAKCHQQNCPESKWFDQK